MWARINLTAHPTAEWTVQQLREAFPFDRIPRYLLRDRDKIFCDDFRRQVRAKVGCSLAAPIQYQQLMPAQHRLRKNRTESAGPHEPDCSDYQVDQKDEGIPIPPILPNGANT
jgi:hypothetical protein